MNGAPDRKETSAMHVIAFNGSPHEKGNTYAHPRLRSLQPVRQKQG